MSKLEKRSVVILAAATGLGLAGAVPAHAENPPLPKNIEQMADKIIKYEHLKAERGTDGKLYDIKIQYGRASNKRINHPNNRRANARDMIAFTRVLISDHLKDKYRKPSADRLSELFPGSMVYSSINGAKWTGPTCQKKKWHKSSEYTTYVALRQNVCSSKGFDSGHRARIGEKMVIDVKLD